MLILDLKLSMKNYYRWLYADILLAHRSWGHVDHNTTTAKVYKIETIVISVGKNNIIVEGLMRNYFV